MLLSKENNYYIETKNPIKTQEVSKSYYILGTVVTKISGIESSEG